MSPISKNKAIRLALPFSVLVHLTGIGIIGAMTCSRSCNKPVPGNVSSAQQDAGTRPKIPPPNIRDLKEIELPAQTDPTEAADPAKIDPVQLKKLEAEKRSFVRDLLSDLRHDRPVSMANFLIKSEVLDRNIRVFKSGKGEVVNEKAIREKYNMVLNLAKKKTREHADPEKKLDALYGFVHFRLFRAYIRHYDSMLDILQTGRFNCNSSTKIMTALEEDLINSNNFGLILLDPPSGSREGHVLNWFRDKNGKVWEIENTKYIQRIPFRAGLQTTKQILIAAYLRGNGVGIDQLPKSLAMLYKRKVRQESGWTGPRPKREIREIFPNAGESHKIPPSPEEPIPNPNFREKADEDDKIPPPPPREDEEIPPPPPHPVTDPCAGKVGVMLAACCQIHPSAPSCNKK